MTALPSIQFSQEFDDSIDKLTLKEQRLVNKKIRKLLAEGISSGYRFKKLSGNSDPNVWELSYNMDLRQIIYLRKGIMLLLKVGHHDVIGWGEKCKISAENMNMAPLVSFTEQVPTIEPIIREDLNSNPPEEVSRPFNHLTSADLTKLGFCEDEAHDLKEMTEDGFLEICETLPRRQSDLLFLIANDEASLEDAERLIEAENANYANRYPVLQNHDLDKISGSMTWQQWGVFLDVHQRDIVEKSFNGSSLVFGAAGTGKTVVAIHRADYLNRQLGKESAEKIGLLTLSKVLADDLKEKTQHFFSSSLAADNGIYVGDVVTLAKKIASEGSSQAFSILTEFELQKRLTTIAENLGLLEDFTDQFVIGEYLHVIGPWDISSLEQYKKFPRIGREKQLKEQQRKQLFEAFNTFTQECLKTKQLPVFEVFRMATEHLQQTNPMFRHLIIDESQDLGPHMLRFVRAITSRGRDDITLCGDSGQAIYNRIHSFKKNGIHVAGNSSRLHINYRTSRQIRELAEKITDKEITNETLTESRSAISRFSGPEPQIIECAALEGQLIEVARWAANQTEAGVKLHEIAIISREEKTLWKIKEHLDANKLPNWLLDESANYISDEIALASVDRIKGLEFKAVAIVDCNDNIFPLESTLKQILPGDTADLKNFLKLEMNRLYVAVSRAKDNLLITYSGKSSELLRGSEYN